MVIGHHRQGGKAALRGLSLEDDGQLVPGSEFQVRQIGVLLASAFLWSGAVKQPFDQGLTTERHLGFQLRAG